MEKWPASPESSQIDAIGMWKKKCWSVNSSLGMQKGLREGLLKILKGCEDLWESALKVGEDDLNDFESNLEPLKGALESFEDASEREIESWDSSEDLDEDQLETEWAWLGFEGMQQRLSWHIICNYVWEENFYFKSFSFFKSVVYLLQDFNL